MLVMPKEINENVRTLDQNKETLSDAEIKAFVLNLIKENPPKDPKLSKEGHLLATKDDPSLYDWVMRG